MSLPRTPSFRLDGRRALVTGASSGIGLGAAVALAEAGAHVICAARGIERLESTVAEMVSAGFSAESLALDVGDLSATKTAISDVGPIDVLVNAAGLARHTPRWGGGKKWKMKINREKNGLKMSRSDIFSPFFSLTLKTQSIFFLSLKML